MTCDARCVTAAIRPATASDIEAIKGIAIDTNMFEPDEVGFFDEMIAGFLDGSMAEHSWLVVEDKGSVVAGACYAPEPFADRMWNLYFISVDPAHQSTGAGAALVRHIETDLRRRGSDVARVLIVETSSTDQYARTREFYARQGFVEEARIRQFYGPADDKVVFWKSLAD
jgi:ribosomal protein S18 acetylase RimI-like enzyme